MIEEDLNTPYENCVKSGFHTDIYQFGNNKLLRLAQLLYIDPEDIQHQFDLFFFGSPTTLLFMRYST